MVPYSVKPFPLSLLETMDKSYRPSCLYPSSSPSDGEQRLRQVLTEPLLPRIQDILALLEQRAELRVHIGHKSRELSVLVGRSLHSVAGIVLDTEPEVSAAYLRRAPSWTLHSRFLHKTINQCRCICRELALRRTSCDCRRPEPAGQLVLNLLNCQPPGRLPYLIAHLIDRVGDLP